MDLTKIFCPPLPKKNTYTHTNDVYKVCRIHKKYFTLKFLLHSIKNGLFVPLHSHIFCAWEARDSNFAGPVRARRWHPITARPRQTKALAACNGKTCRLHQNKAYFFVVNLRPVTRRKYTIYVIVFRIKGRWIFSIGLLPQKKSTFPFVPYIILKRRICPFILLRSETATRRRRELWVTHVSRPCFWKPARAAYAAPFVSAKFRRFKYFTS